MYSNVVSCEEMHVHTDDSSSFYRVCCEYDVRNICVLCFRKPCCKMEDSFDCDCGELEPPDH